MSSPDQVYFRCIKATDGYKPIAEGDVLPGWRDKDGDLVIAYDDYGRFPIGRGKMPWLREHFVTATAEEFENSIKQAMQAVDKVSSEQSAFLIELSGFSTDALGAGEQPAATSGAIQTVNPAGQLRNRAHSLKRRANELGDSLKEKKELLERKLEQKMAAALSTLRDMKDVVEKLTEVVHTVQLYLGQDEEIECLRSGEPAAADTPLCIRQNVLFMDEECAAEHEHGIDFTEITAFDEWLLAKPEHLSQVLPEPKGVVVLQVRRNRKQYEAKDLGELMQNVAKDEANKESYWLIRNGENLHRIHTSIRVGERLIPRETELDHFFFERRRGAEGFTDEEVPHRPGSREYLQAMEAASAVRRHYMRLALVIQGLIDRTQLFAPYMDGVRPNLLDPLATPGAVHYLRDVEGTLTDGRPSFSEWLKEVNAGLQHGHRIVGSFPTYFREKEDARISPRCADGVLNGVVHSVVETGKGLRFTFTRTDSVYRAGWQHRHDSYSPAKTAGSYRIERDDKFFVCIDGGANIEDMEYYISDRRQRHEYQHMIPTLREAIAAIRKEKADEQPFRDLLLRKLSEATPNSPCTPEQLDRLILWYKTKTKEHRALLEDDGKAYRMIYDRHVAQQAPDSMEEDQKAMLEAVARMPNAVYAFHLGGRDYGVLLTIDEPGFYLREETWRITRKTAHLIERDTKPFVLAQKSHYQAFPSIYVSPAWLERPASFSGHKHLSPAHYPALLEFVKNQPWFIRNRDADAINEGNESVVAVYVIPSPEKTRIIAASIEIDPSSGWGLSRKSKHAITETISMPSGHERDVYWSGNRQPTFHYHHSWGTRTHIDFHGNLSTGWREGCHLLFLDQAVLDQTADVVAKRTRHNKRANGYNTWFRRSVDLAKEAVYSAWKAQQFAKYTKEGGDGEFFEDHLKTLPRKLPPTGFIDGLLSRAVLGGKKVSAISATPIADLMAEFPPMKGSDDDESNEDALKILSAEGWMAPPKAKGDAVDE